MSARDAVVRNRPDGWASRACTASAVGRVWVTDPTAMNAGIAMLTALAASQTSPLMHSNGPIRLAGLRIHSRIPAAV